jgi:hypothetical protein
MSHSDEAVHRLGYHPVASDAQRRLYEENRERFMEVFDYIETVGGPSREKSVALTHVQEALMWLNAHVACNGIYADVQD